jgi:PncC family amidohydrolase
VIGPVESDHNDGPSSLDGLATVAVAESCTGGLLMARLVGMPGAGDWFRGGLVAYDEKVKFDLLGVTPGPVVTPEAAAEMARGARDLLGCRIGISTTGEAGPIPSESAPVGTIYVGLADGVSDRVFHTLLSGDPAQIRAAAVDFAVGCLRSLMPAPSGG